MPKASVAARASRELVERLGYDPYEASTRLVALQTKRGLTGRELAERMGSHESDVSRLRNAGQAAQRGSNLPSRAVWDKAAEALKTSSEWLLFGKGPVDVEPRARVSLEDVLQAIRGINVKLDRILEAVGVTPNLDIAAMVEEALDVDPGAADRVLRAIVASQERDK